MSTRTVKIIEGFDMVGKDTFIEMLGGKVYRPDYSFLDEVAGRDASFVFGQTLYDYFYNAQIAPYLILNRGIASSYVYTKLHNKDMSTIMKLIDWYNNNPVFVNYSCIIHVCHKDKITAEKIYSNALSNKEMESLDQYASFDEYWNTYNTAEAYYDEVYSLLNIPVIKVINDDIQ